MSSTRRTHVLVLAILVAAFVAFYPSLETAGPCDGGECPHAAHATTMASLCLASVCAAAVLSVPYAASILGATSRRRSFSDRRPAEIYLPPDTQPPIPS